MKITKHSKFFKTNLFSLKKSYVNIFNNKKIWPGLFFGKTFLAQKNLATLLQNLSQTGFAELTLRIHEQGKETKFMNPLRVGHAIGRA
jgi:hypothetical protein